MSPADHQEAKELFSRILNLQPREREALLSQACAGRPELRQEVESLFGAYQRAGDFIDKPLAEVMAGNQMPALLGRILGSYHIDSVLGQGGMGVVYRATDTKLHRPVAVKVLSGVILDQPAQRRFQREAQTASSLNHPHVLTVYDAGVFEGRDYLVSEFVDGGTLADWARAEKRSWKQIVELLTGVADGLAVVHEAGILHRDIKPANILVTRSGYAKLADFGLAKPAIAKGRSIDRTATTGTVPGMVLGTIAYMSPEQAAGKPVDARSDIFSFGVVLYELLANRRPFEGQTDGELLQTIIDGTPRALPTEIPQALRTIVEKALEKDQADRYQSMREMVVDLRHVSRETQSSRTATLPGSMRKRIVAWAVMIVALTMGAGAAVFWNSHRSQAEALHIRSIVVLPLEDVSGDVNQAFLSAGLTDALISALSQIRELKVISRTTAMRYKGAQKSLPEIGRELGVDGAVVGSVQRAGDRIRVNAQLIRASADSQLWTQTYDRDLGDVLRLEGEVARAVAHEIRLELSADEAHRLAGRHINPAAQEAFLRCMYHSWNFNDPDMSESIRECEEAVRLQPDFAAAYAGIAQGWSGRVILGFIRPQEGEAPSRDAARKALELGPDLPDSHDAWAMVLSTFDRDFAGAEREEKRALELDPNFVAALNDYSYILIGVDRLSEATALIEHAIALDPFNSALHVTYGLALTGQRRYTEAAQQFQRNLELDPKSSFGKASLLFIAEQTRDPQEFLKELEEQARADGRDVRQYAMTGRLYARLGRRADAMLVVSNLAKTARPDPFGIASIYAALGDKDHCFEFLAKMSFLPRGIRISPLFDNVRSDQRFEQSLKHVPGA